MAKLPFFPFLLTRTERFVSKGFDSCGNFWDSFDLRGVRGQILRSSASRRPAGTTGMARDKAPWRRRTRELETGGGAAGAPPWVRQGLGPLIPILSLGRDVLKKNNTQRKVRVLPRSGARISTSSFEYGSSKELISIGPPPSPQLFREGTAVGSGRTCKKC